MRYSLIVVAVGIVALGATGAKAQGCAADHQSCTTTLSATVPTIVEFGAISGTFDFGTITAAQFNANLATAPGPVTLTHHGNVPYTVSVNAAAATLAFVQSHGDPNPNKPVGDVTINEQTDGEGAPVPVTLTAAGSTLYQRLAKGTTYTTTMTADMALDYANDVPGAYTSTITFTIAAN